MIIKPNPPGQTLILHLPVELAGRKAAALGRLAGAGFPVPPGVCIPTGAFRVENLK